MIFIGSETLVTLADIVDLSAWICRAMYDWISFFDYTYFPAIKKRDESDEKHKISI